MVISCRIQTMSKTPENMSETYNSYYDLLTDWLLGATIGNHSHSVIGLLCS